MVFKECDCFDPKSVAKTITDALQEIGIERFANVRFLYAIGYPKGPTITSDQTGVIKEVFPTGLNLILDFIKKRYLEAVGPNIFRPRKKSMAQKNKPSILFKLRFFMPLG